MQQEGLELVLAAHVLNPEPKRKPAKLDLRFVNEV